MKTCRFRMAASLLLVLPVSGPAAFAQSDAESTRGDPAGAGIARANTRAVETLHVYGEPDKTDTATKLNLSVMETPQSISVVSRAQIEDFSLRDVNDLLDYVPGVTVESVETDRTYYTARGFDVVNFQYDGVGVPFVSGLTQGQQDTAIYEQVEVVKGATGLITGLANPSATVNFIRKRPEDELMASAAVTVGEWDTRRVEGDITAPITSRVSGRLVVAREEAESYLDRYADDSDVVYGVISADITDSTQLTVGHSYNKSEADGNLWGALPLFYSDGSLTDYSASTSTAPEWTFWDVERKQTFVEFKQSLSSNWDLQLLYTDNDIEQESELFYVTGNPDPVTEEGLSATTSRYVADQEQAIVDLFVTGSFDLLGQTHQLVVGVNLADIELTGGSHTSSQWPGYVVLGGDWAQGNSFRPEFDTFNPATSGTDIEQEQDSYYISSRLNATDRLSLLLGARTMEIDQKGIDYGASQDVEESETVPYAGATYDVTDQLILYSSYSEVFTAQVWLDESYQPLGPAEGESREAGIKYGLEDGRATITLAYFESEHSNLGEFASRDDNTLALYRGIEVESDGFELEVSGELTDGLSVSAGYTDLDIEGDDGEDARTYIPRKQFKLAMAYRLPMLDALKVGAGIKWQDEVSTTSPVSGESEVVQDSYTLVDVFARYELTPNLTLAVNVDNITDEKYLKSAQWTQAYYGAPRNAQASLTWRY